jgi:7-keto-8-aminopelargonate synthetase-like enzyme
VEQAGAQACGTADSVYFGSGYLIGAIALSSIEEPVGWILLDGQAHYNLVDAAKVSGAVIDEFDHCNTESLSDRLVNRHANMRHPPIVLTDGVFATTGNVPPLHAYAEVLARYNGRLVVDESHGFGVVGPDGRGAADYHGLNSGVIAGATLSKAFCAQGALLGCSREVAARVRRRPPIRGTGAGSPLSAAAATASLAYAAARPELREGLRAMASYLRLRLRELGVEVIDSPAPIVSFRWGRYADMQALQRRLFEREIYIYHSNYIGSGPDGVIRCAVFRDHSRGDIDTLISEMRA